MTAPVQILPADAPLSDWLAARRKGIGGSDVGAILRVSRWAGPVRVFYDKLGLLDDVDTDEMEWGRRLEAAVRQKFADEHPEFHVRQGPGLVAHPERPWQRATIDGLAAESPDGEPVALIEVKTGRSGVEEWGDELTDEVPLPYLCQFTWYLDVFGLPAGFLAVLLDGRSYREYLIEYDPDLARKLRGHCEAFWRNHILTGVAPEADGLADTTDVLAARHHPKRGSKGDLPAEAVGWASIYGAAHQDALRAEGRKQEAGNHLRQAFVAVGSPHHGYVDGRKVASWSLVGGGTKDEFDLPTFATEHPDLYAKYLITKSTEPGRRLSVSKEFTSA